MQALQKTINAIDHGLCLLIKPLVVTLSLLIAVLMVTGIVSRELVGQPLLGLEEIVLTSVMWLYMMGAALASREGTHLRGDFVTLLTKNPDILARIRLLAGTITFFMAIVFSVWAFSLMSWGFERQQSTAVLRIPLYVAQSSMFTCSVIIVFYCFRDVLYDVRALSVEPAQ